jgi:hypothetical protein
MLLLVMGLLQAPPSILGLVGLHDGEAGFNPHQALCELVHECMEIVHIFTGAPVSFAYPVDVVVHIINNVT